MSKPNLDMISAIQAEKQKNVNSEAVPPIDPEIKYLAEGKRFTFDVITIPVDPLR